MIEEKFRTATLGEVLTPEAAEAYKGAALLDVSVYQLSGVVAFLMDAADIAKVGGEIKLVLGHCEDGHHTHVRVKYPEADELPESNVLRHGDGFIDGLSKVAKHLGEMVWEANREKVSDAGLDALTALLLALTGHKPPGR